MQVFTPNSTSSDERANTAHLRQEPRWLPDRVQQADWLLIAVVLFVVFSSLLLHIPILANADSTFNSDEACCALVVKHMLEGKGFALHSWEAYYHGIIPALLSIPFFVALGYVPLAVKLGGLVCLPFFQVTTMLLSRLLYGRTAAIITGCLLIGTSAHMVLWSSLATCGFTLLWGWQALSLILFETARKRVGNRVPSSIALFAGLVIGLGLYIWELYIAFVITTAIALAVSFVVTGRSRIGKFQFADCSRMLYCTASSIALFIAGLAIGLAPTLYHLISAGPTGKRPFYELANHGTIFSNIGLLVQQCLPAMFSLERGSFFEANLVGGIDLFLPASLLIICVYLGAWIWSMHRVISWYQETRLEPLPPTEFLLVLAPAVHIVLFIISANPSDILSSRYIAPGCACLLVLAGGFLAAIAKRAKWPVIFVTCTLVVFSVVQIVDWEKRQGWLSPKLHVQRVSEPLPEVLEYLKLVDIKGGYADYWTAYKASFFSKEEIIFTTFPFAPLFWERNPEYTKFVAALPNPCYIISDPNRATLFEQFADAFHRPFTKEQIGPYSVYTSPSGKRIWP